MVKYKLYQWLILAFISLLVQGLGNDIIPELNGLGIVIAILFLCAVYMENQK